MDIAKIMEVVMEWIPKVSMIVTACAAIAAVTPTKVDDRICQLILDVINKLGLNVGKATNKDAE